MLHISRHLLNLHTPSNLVIQILTLTDRPLCIFDHLSPPLFTDLDILQVTQLLAHFSNVYIGVHGGWNSAQSSFPLFLYFERNQLIALHWGEVIEV